MQVGLQMISVVLCIGPVTVDIPYQLHDSDNIEQYMQVFLKDKHF